MLIRLYLPFALVLVGSLLAVTNLPTLDISTDVSGRPNWMLWFMVGVMLAVAGSALLIRRLDTQR